MKVALAGQPNCGKSTLFNALVGYRSLTSNFAGTTVSYTRGQARINGNIIDLCDLPGLYSLIPANPAETSSRDSLLEDAWDVIINVVDASQLARSLELTLELSELERPMVVCLNMMDEAARKGMTIDVPELASALGLPVIETIASRGRGIVETMRAAIGLVRKSGTGRSSRPVYPAEIEKPIEDLARWLDRCKAQDHSRAPYEPARLRIESSAAWARNDATSPSTAIAETFVEEIGLRGDGGLPAEETWSRVSPGEPSTHHSSVVLRCFSGCCGTAARQEASSGPAGVLQGLAGSDRIHRASARVRALWLLQSDPGQLAGMDDETAEQVSEALAALPRREGEPPEDVIPAARHAACLRLFEKTVRVNRPRTDWRDRLDGLVMDRLWGYVFLAAVFFTFFHVIFDAGQFAETRILALFDRLTALLAVELNPHSLAFVVGKGGLLGVAGAVGSVLPYLVPFLIGLAVMEDLGYLARIGYLMDSAMHRLGLHGTATLPVILGYGCSVPAVMATRILPSRRDRFVAGFLAILVPCSARMTVIMALVGLYLGANWALAIYGINFAVVALAGVILARIWPEISPGMLMEVPPYRRPNLRSVLLKTWFRLREFVTVATPLLIGGSIVLSAVDYFRLDRWINAGLSPLTGLLGLPAATGLTLIFGVLRKELSLLMLMQALGTTHVAAVMSTTQIVVFTLFVTFYLPCLATAAMMGKELGWKLTAAASGALLLLAIAISVLARFALRL